MKRMLSGFILLSLIFFMNNTSCKNRNTGTPPCGLIYCGPLVLVTSTQTDTGYAIGNDQLLKIDSTGNTIFTLPLQGIGSGLWINTMDVSAKTNNIWVASNDGSGSNVLTILNSNGTLLTQTVTKISKITSVKLSKTTNIGWIAGFSNTGTTMLEALSASGTLLSLFTIPSSLSTSNSEPIKLAISPVNDTVWAWSDGKLSGFTLTGMKFGPYFVNISETTDASYRKQIIINPVTGDIWIGSPATSTVIVYTNNGTIRFQKDVGINIYTMAVSPKTGNVWIGNLNRIEVLDPFGNMAKQFLFKDISNITIISISLVNDNVWIGNAIKAGTQDNNFFILNDNGTILHASHIGINCNLCI